MRRQTLKEVYDSIKGFRETHNMHSELKWSKVSNQKLEQYMAFVDLFFSLNSVNRIQFHSVIFDSHQANHVRYNNGDSDIGLSKLYYDLIFHKFIKRCGRDSTLFACLDHRISSTSLHDLKAMLNATAARDCGFGHRPLKQIESRDSKKDSVLQMNDVILGAVCAIKNGRHLLIGTREAKRELAKYVLAKSGIHSFDGDTPINMNRFTVWNKRPRPR